MHPVLLSYHQILGVNKEAVYVILTRIALSDIECGQYKRELLISREGSKKTNHHHSIDLESS